MVEHSHKQEEALKDEKRFAIYEYLRTAPLAVTIRLIQHEVEKAPRDFAACRYHVTILVDAGLVEKTGDHPATYKAVEL